MIIWIAARVLVARMKKLIKLYAAGNAIALRHIAMVSSGKGLPPRVFKRWKGTRLRNATPVREGDDRNGRDRDQRSEIRNQKSEIGSQKSEVGDQGQGKNEKSPLERGGCEADGVCESSDNQQSKTCVICHDPDKKILNKRSQTCGACYQAWNGGKVEHPTLGKFTLSLTKSKITKKKKTEVRNQKSEVKEAPGVVRESADQGEKIQVEIIPVEETSGQPSTQSSAAPGKPEVDKLILKSMADAAAQEVIAEIKAASKAGLILNLDNYPKIKAAVHNTAEKYFVTPEHVVIGLLGEALAAREPGDE